MSRQSSGTKRRQPSTAHQSSSKKSSSQFSTTQLRNDRLGTLVRQLCEQFASAESWEAFVSNFRGPSYLSQDLDDLDHDAAALLRQWRDEGVPAVSNADPWTLEQKDECIQRGCHYSANEHADFIRDEMAGFLEDRFWMVLPYELVRHLEQIMFSPAAIKEERERKPRLLCDHSWDWGWPSINQSTEAHAPPEAMQFGGTFHRLLYAIRHANPRYGPVRSSKSDVKDGFYRLFLRALDCLRLAVILPKYEGEPQLVGIPMACTMGWVQSPPTFCTMSETVCDEANRLFRMSPNQAPPHRLEATAAVGDDLSRDMCPRPVDRPSAQEDLALAGILHDSAPDDVAPPSNCPSTKPLGLTDVFVDDFIQLGQGGPARMKALRRHLFHAIDSVLAQPDVSTDKRREALSLKKMMQGDGCWSTRKVLLGWIVDTVRQTLELPPHRKQALNDIFSTLASKKRVSRKLWERILGKLRFVSVAIPGSASLFCAMQLALNKSEDSRVRITRSLRDHIDAFAALAADLSSRPTHLAEIVPQEPTLLGTTDAAKAGMGGIFYDSTGKPFVWRFPFPDDIQRDLVSYDNPNGSITNSDLEQAGILAQTALMAHHFDVRYATLANGGDNIPAVSRMSKGAVSSDRAPAYLCDYASALQREHRYCSVNFYLPGPDNVMSDDASRLQHLSDPVFLAHFEQHYPQSQPWTILALPDSVSSPLLSALRCKSPLPLPRVKPDAPKITPLAAGSSSASPSTRIHPSVMSLTKKPRSDIYSSTASNTATPERPTTLSALIPWVKNSKPLARGSPTWTSQIPARKQALQTSIPYSLLSSRPSETKTTLPPVSTLATSPYSKVSSTPSTLSTRPGVPSTLTSSISVSSRSSSYSAPANTASLGNKTPDAVPFSSGTSTLPLMARSTVAPRRP